MESCQIGVIRDSNYSVVLYSILAAENVRSPPERKVMCYPVQLPSTAPRIPPTMVTSNVDGETTTIRYGRDSHKINTAHMFKLVGIHIQCADVISYNVNYLCM